MLDLEVSFMTAKKKDNSPMAKEYRRLLKLGRLSDVHGLGNTPIPCRTDTKTGRTYLLPEDDPQMERFIAGLLGLQRLARSGAHRG
jgi:hypothetical protein